MAKLSKSKWKKRISPLLDITLLKHKALNMVACMIKCTNKQVNVTTLKEKSSNKGALERSINLV